MKSATLYYNFNLGELISSSPGYHNQILFKFLLSLLMATALERCYSRNFLMVYPGDFCVGKQTVSRIASKALKEDRPSGPSLSSPSWLHNFLYGQLLLLTSGRSCPRTALLGIPPSSPLCVISNLSRSSIDSNQPSCHMFDEDKLHIDV
jgi:hypothetical protein